MKPLNDRLILQPSDSSMRGLLFIPDTHKDAATSCLVIAKGPKVTAFIKTGSVVLCETGFGERKNLTISNTRQFWCKESNIYAVIINNIMYPLGNRILLKRDIEETQVGGIIIPANRRYQSLDAEVVRIGLSTKPLKVAGIVRGMKVRLVDWEPHMIGVTLEDGSYGLIVNDKDLLFAYGNKND